ncbi:hypothetical protein D8674_004542 [Pyrus ussuriensis x Pyrus communis]|uniref:Uncharacterized protein n=1 Tax=Pyrus ussuriensis x Pyrus communis TaxID=2448454 RepID=A0A5N5FL04_9ROSA|nr:hypothetical protein D8674_004542 [Pyrus ussuriensis x Pyrus communis]
MDDDGTTTIANLVDDGGLQIDEDGVRDVFSGDDLEEDGVKVGVLDLWSQLEEECVVFDLWTRLNKGINGGF